MSDADAPLTRLFNRSTQPRVISWGDGVVMPGESFLTANPEGYAPDQPNSDWTVDPEATAALQAPAQPPVANPSPSAPDGSSGAQDASQGANQVAPPDLAVMPNPEAVAEQLTAEAERLTAEAERLSAEAEAANPAASQAATTQE